MKKKWRERETPVCSGIESVHLQKKEKPVSNGCSQRGQGNVLTKILDGRGTLGGALLGGTYFDSWSSSRLRFPTILLHVSITGLVAAFVR